MIAGALDRLNEIGRRIESASGVLLGLDFDGTLAPHVDDPASARLPLRTRSVLQNIAESERRTLAVISGRTLDDLREKVGIDGLFYAGNHGLDVAGPACRRVDRDALKRQPTMARVIERLAADAGQLPGVVVEDKTLTASVHFRRMSPGRRSELEAIVQTVVAVGDAAIQIRRGNHVWEILPSTAWNKGEALRWIQRQAPTPDPLVIYLGDDRTDEDVFKAFPQQIMVKVGAGHPTAANYSLGDESQVVEFLEWLAGDGAARGSPATPSTAQPR